MQPPLEPDFAARLGAHRPRAVEPKGPDAAAFGRAAVAALLRPRDDGLELLLMVRPVRAGDRWSGQVCLPGGRREPEDLDLVHTARRETREELGFDPAEVGRPLGRLGGVQARARGGPLPLWIEPYVWLAERPVTPLVSAEAEQHFWLPLGPVARGECSSTWRHQDGERTLLLPAFRHGEFCVWGLTHHILGELLDVVAPSRIRATIGDRP